MALKAFSGGRFGAGFNVFSCSITAVSRLDNWVREETGARKEEREEREEREEMIREGKREREEMIREGRRGRDRMRERENNVPGDVMRHCTTLLR